MNLVLPIPDDIAVSLGGDVERQALEVLALESHRAGRLSKGELHRMLGIESRLEVDAFLEAHDVYDPITIEEAERQMRGVQSLVRRRRMSVEQMLAVGAEIVAMPLLDPRSPAEIMEDLSAL